MKEIELHRCNGTHDALINLADQEIEIVEGVHTDFDAEGTVGGLTEDRVAEIFRLLNLGRPAGVYFTFRYIPIALDLEVPFFFDGFGNGLDGADGAVFVYDMIAATENPTP